MMLQDHRENRVHKEASLRVSHEFRTCDTCRGTKEDFASDTVSWQASATKLLVSMLCRSCDGDG